jgi:predicted phage-related endonuclease
MTNLDRLLKSYSEYANMAKQIEKYMKDIKSEILTELGDTTEYIGNDHSVKYSKVVSHRLDTKAVKEKYPEVAEACTVASESFRFIVK